MLEANIYKALGDPIRLKMVMRLANKSPRSLSELSEGLGISRQGARKQIQVLASAELLNLKPQGRETQVWLNTKQLQIARKFITQLEQQWDRRLGALKQFVEDDSEA